MTNQHHPALPAHDLRRAARRYSSRTVTVGQTLEEQGLAGFRASYQQVLTALAAKAHQLSRR